MGDVVFEKNATHYVKNTPEKVEDRPVEKGG